MGRLDDLKAALITLRDEAKVCFHLGRETAPI